MSASSAKFVNVHYHRLCADYDGWDLWVWGGKRNLLLSQVRPGRYTAFGTVFRFDASLLFGDGKISTPVGVLPRFGEWLNSDSPDKYIAEELFETVQDDGLHLFMVEGDGHLYRSPADVLWGDNLRFLCVQIHTAPPARADAAGTLCEAAMDPWVLAYDQTGVRKEFFPATKRLRSRFAAFRDDICLVDCANFFGNRISLCLCTDPVQLFEANLQEHALWKASDKCNFVRLSLASDDPKPVFSRSPVDFLTAVLQEAVFVIGNSAIRELEDQNPKNANRLQLPLTLSRRRNVIKVYYQRLDRTAQEYSLAVHFVSSPTHVWTVAREQKLYRDSAVFLVDLNAVPQSSLACGLVFNPVIAETGEKTGAPVTWRRESGLSVILAESYDELLLPANVDVSVQYHRFDGCADWADWELLAWTSGDDEYKPRTASIKSSLHLRSGVILFDMTGVLFRKGDLVHVQPVKKVLRPGKWHTAESGEQYQGESYHEVVFRDIVRTWTSGDLAVPQVHLIQGDPACYPNEPKRSVIVKDRFFRLRYMRHEANDYKNWDLWTWEECEDTTTNVAIPPENSKSTGDWVDFVVDRAKYAAGATIHVIPRHGGDAWDVKDEPVRIWQASMLCEEISIPSKPPMSASVDGEYEIVKRTYAASTFIILEGSSLVLNKLVDVQSMLTAQVNRKGCILLSAPAPLTWLNPSGFRKSLRFSEIGLKLVQSPRDSFKKGKRLHIRRMRCVSPTIFHLTPEDNCLINEDFPVENIRVSVPGFDTVSLQWCRYTNTDQYYYSGKLGLSYSPEESVFRCFAPNADRVSVVLYNTATGDEGRFLYPMRRIPEGCWKVSVKKNLRGRFYKLLAEAENKLLFPGVEVIDPYSRCNTSHNGRGLILGEENTVVAPRPNISAAETIVYELHIRDATIDECSGVEQRGKYLGLAERGTKFQHKKFLEKEMFGGESHGALAERIPDVGNNEPHSTIQRKSCAMLEKLSTSLEHIVQMGVTAVQIMPVQDFDNDETDNNAYRWGYMPVHFNSPDGWYASTTTTSARITELKVLIDTLHRAGLKVIMDVVYNHTAEDKNERNLDARFSFNGLSPRYYYRTCANTPKAHTGDSTCAYHKPGKPTCGACYSNGSGCGNEFRSESPMGRKFIIDSLCYWANEYQIDGFRFDLLGLIDLETITKATQVLHDIDPNIVVYGEPWVGGLTPICMTDKGSQRSRGFSVFNNTFRDAIRGSPFGLEETFLMDGGRLDEVKRGLIGSIDDFCDSPLESINYVECHDNYTLWDHMKFYIKSRTDDIVFTDEDLRRMHMLSAVMIFTAQGIPFIQMGQEMCRTKFGVENSYESPDEINKIRWEKKILEWKTVQYYHGLIQLRRAHPEIFALRDSALVRSTVSFYEDIGLPVPERCVAFRIKGNPTQLCDRLMEENGDKDIAELKEESEKWDAIVVLLNPTPEHVVFPLPEHSTDCVWMQIVDENFSGVKKIQGPLVGSVTVPGRAAAILRKASGAEHKECQVQLRLACVTDAYAVPGGDDELTSYAVSLSKERSANELRTHLDLISRRQRFERSTAAPILNSIRR